MRAVRISYRAHFAMRIQSQSVDVLAICQAHTPQRFELVFGQSTTRTPHHNPFKAKRVKPSMLY